MADTVVAAEGLGVRTRRGWVFRDVHLRAGRRELVAVAGPGGSGRSSLLLTVGGRMRPSAGSLEVCGLALPAEARRVRRRTAVARVGGAAEADEELRVGDHVRERALAAGVAPGEFGWACERLEAGFDDKDVVGGLPAEQVTLLLLALALMTAPQVVLLDDLDQGAGTAGQRRMWEAARKAADAGPFVLASTTEPAPAEGLADRLVELGA